MNTAYLSATKIVNLDALVSAEWLDGRSAILLVTVAGRGFAQPNTAEVAEPFASELWRLVCPAADVEADRTQPHSTGPADRTQPAPTGPAKVRGAWGNANGNGHSRPSGALGMPTSYGPGHRSGNGGAALPTRFPPRSASADGLPTRAAHLFPWCKKQGQRCGVDLVGYLQAWGSEQGFRGMFKDWSDREVRLAVAEAEAFLQEQGEES